MLLALLACLEPAEDPTPADCLDPLESGAVHPTTEAAEIAVTGAPDADTWVAADLTLTGYAISDWAIEWIEVLGVRAAASTTNYAQWTVKLPLDTLQAAADGDGRVSVEVLAKLSCGASAASFGHVELRVLPDTGVPVTGLTLVVVAPEGCWLPSGDPAGVDVRVCADAASAGGKVQLTGSAGAFADADGLLDLTASADDPCGTGQGAAARTWYRPGSLEGTASLVATAYPSLLQAASVWVAGPPVYSPTALTLGAGRTATASVSTGGTLAACRLVGDTAALASVTVDGAPVAPVVSFPPFEGACEDFLPDGARSVEVVVAEGVSATSATLACTDGQGQTAELVITVGG